MRMKRRIRTDVCLILCGILVWFLADARQLRLEAAKALTLCAGTVIPALFPFMVVTGLLVRLGFGQWLAPDMAGLMASLFRLPGCAGSALLLGLVGGYPIGARTAAELYASGDLTRQEAERLLTFCNNSNPVFLISVLGVGVFGSVRAGLWLWLIHVCAALLTGLLFRGLGRGRKTVPPRHFLSGPLSASGLCVIRPGQRRDHALRLRLRHVLLCADLAPDGPPRPMGGPGRGLRGAVLPDAPPDL